MQILVLIAYTVVLLAAGTNAASFVNQSQLQYDTVEVEDTEMSTQVTGKRLLLPFPCTPDYQNMVSSSPRDMLKVRAPGSICFAANGNFAIPSQASAYYFLIFDKSGKLIKNGTYNRQVGAVTGCAFSSSALYFADPVHRRIHEYTTKGDYVGIFAIGGAKYFRLAAAGGNLYATITVPINDYTAIAFKERTGRVACRIKGRGLHMDQSVAFDTKGNLNVAYGKTTDVYTPDCKYLHSRIYTKSEVDGGIYGLTFDGSNNNVIIDNGDEKVKVFSPKPHKCLKELGPFKKPIDVGIGKDCSLYVVDIMRNAVYVY